MPQLATAPSCHGRGDNKRVLVRYTPLVFSVIWFALPFVALATSPLQIYIENFWQVFLYVLTNILFFSAGYILFCKSAKAGSPSLNLSPSKLAIRVIHIGFWLSVVLLPPSIYVYTGKSLLDYSSVLDQKAVYSELASTLAEESSIRKVISFIRGLAAPFSLIGVAISACYWRHISRKTKFAALGTVLCLLILSAFRGTDKEIGDILILVFVGVFVSSAQQYLSGVKNEILSVRRMIFVLLMVFVFLFIFIWRKSERMGGFVSFCLFNEVACYESGGGTSFADAFLFGWAMLSAYFMQGYYGLGLALNLNSDWTWGIGHSPPLQTVFGLFFDTRSTYEAGLLAQLRTVGWDDRAVWSSIFPSLASDLTFYGVPPFFAAIGGLFGHVWAVLMRRQSTSALALFAMITILIIYVPANNQIMQSFDLYFATIGWLLIFLLAKKKQTYLTPRV